MAPWRPNGRCAKARPTAACWMLYLADFLEPGRDFDREARAALAARVPAQRADVLREVAARRITWVVRSGWPLPPETVDFWNALVSA